MPLDTETPATVVDADLIAKKAPLQYVAGVAKDVGLSAHFQPDHHVCGFVTESQADHPRTPVIVVGNEEASVAYMWLGHITTTLHPTALAYLEANAKAMKEAQEDYQRFAIEAQAQYQAHAEVFNQEIAALHDRNDPMFQFLLDAICTSTVELLRLTGKTSINQHHVGIIISMASVHLTRNQARFEQYLNNGADEALAECRRVLAGAEPPPNGDEVH